MTNGKQKKIALMYEVKGGQRFRFADRPSATYIMGRDYVDMPTGINSSVLAFDCWNELENQSERFNARQHCNTKVEIIA